MLSVWLRRFVSPEYMVSGDMKCGDIPSAREIYGKGLAIAGPSVMEYFLLSLIMMADTIMVGTLGHTAIAAVGITSQPRFLVLALVLSMNVGVTSVTARRYGEGNNKGANDCLKQSLVLCMFISLACSTAAYAFSRRLLLFAGAQPDIIGMSQSYFKIIMLGTPVNCLSFTICSALRGIGHTRVTMVVNMTANIVNVLFNYLLIGGKLGFPRLEADGAAIATVIGWCTGLVIALFAVLRPHSYYQILTVEGWRPTAAMLRTLSKVATGAFIEQITMRIGFFLYNKFVANLGTLVYAANQICMNLTMLSFAVGEGLGIAASSLVGQNLGAKRPDLSALYAKTLQRVSLIYCVTLMLIFTTFGRSLVRLFSDVPEILDIGARLLIISGIVVLFQASQMIYMGSLRGAGDTMYIAVISTISMMTVRPGLAYILAYGLNLGIIGAWLSFLTDQFIRFMMTYIRFRGGMWKKIKL